MSDDVKHSWHSLGEQMSALGAVMQERFAEPAARETKAATEQTTEQSTLR